jgi:hypothetical protein
MKHSTGKATKAQKARFEAAIRLGCVLCAHFGKPVSAAEMHHLLSGNRRMGHDWSIPLCRPCHRNINALTKSGEPSERELWTKVQQRLHLSTDWPTSKMLPRRYA